MYNINIRPKMETWWMSMCIYIQFANNNLTGAWTFVL